MINISDYDYFLPKSLIANKPALPRDHSKLLVYDTATDTISYDYFINLDKYLPKKSFLVLNDTKVIPARITLYKSPPIMKGHALPGGDVGKVKVLFLVNEISQNQKLNIKYQNDILKGKNRIKNERIRGYVDRKIEVGDRLYLDSFHCINTIKQEGAIFTFEYSFSKEKLFQLLGKKGTTPIPLYIKDTPLNESELRKKYQTIFFRPPVGAGLLGSSAAPTASLHFTNRVIKKLERAEIKRFFITLHVGLGTFAPINEKNIQEKKLHEEYCEIKSETFHCINTMKSQGNKLVAVGTTVARTVESVRISPLRGQLKSVMAKTDLFIFSPYNFQMVDCLITNFHLPKSSLMMLVEAFLQHKIKTQPSPRLRRAGYSLIDLYKIAIDKKYRFYSFGDAMLII